MYPQKGNLGARIGAYLLDMFFIYIISCVCIFNLYIYFGFSFVVIFFYFAIFEGSTMSATPGKKICGLIVVDENGNPLTMQKSFLRALGRLVTYCTLGIGYFVAFFDANGKALHDHIANTFVADANSVYVGQSYNQYGTAPNNNMYNQPTTYNAPRPAMNGPKIVGVTGQFAGRVIPISPQGVMFGRDATTCEFAFPDNTVGISRNHCKVQFKPESQLFVLYDLGSSYGTFLANDSRIAQGQPIALRAGDEFYLASRANTFRVSF